MAKTLQSLSNILNDAVGLEKCLKLAQGTAQIAVSWTPHRGMKVRWEGARGNFALARRYFRLLKWVDCWSLAQKPYHLSSNRTKTKVKAKNKATGDDVTPSFLNDGVEETEKSAQTFRQQEQEEEDAKNQLEVYDLHAVLTTMKWSLLGMYYFLEMFTITNILSLTTFPWSDALQIEAYKFWVYGLASSILLGLWELYSLQTHSQSSTTAPSAPGAAKITATTTGQGERESRDRMLIDGGVSGNEMVTPPFSQPSSSPPPPPLLASSEQDLAEDNAHGALESKTRLLFSKKNTALPILKQLMIDILDILFPATAVGWLPVPPVFVGEAGVISALISLLGIWGRVNGG